MSQRLLPLVLATAVFGCQKHATSERSSRSSNTAEETTEPAFGVATTGAFIKPCADRSGSARYFEGTGACTGNLMTSIALPTAIALYHNSQRSDYNTCVAPGWSLSVDRYITTSSGTVVTDGTGTSIEFSGPTGANTLNATDPLLTRNVIQVGLPMKEVTPEGVVLEYDTLAVNGRYYLIKITNRFGQSTTLARSAGCVTDINEPYNFHITLSYINNKLAKVTDNAGTPYNIAYSSDGTLQSVNLPDGRFWSVSQAGSGLVSSLINPDGQRTSFGYFPGTNVLRSITNANNWMTSFAYTASTVTRTVGSEISTETFSNGRLTGTSDQGKSTQISRDPTGNVTQITDPMSRSTQFQYLAADGKPCVFNADGTTVQTSALYVLPCTVTDFDATVTTYRYNSNLNVTNITTTNQGKTVSSAFTWDPVRSQLLSKTTNGRTAKFNYSNGNLTSVIDENNQTVSSSTYDALGQMTSTTDRFNRSTQLVWTNGQVTQITDYLGRVTTRSYDSLQNLTSNQSFDGSRDDYTYDAMGNLTGSTTTVSSAGGVHTLQSLVQPTYYSTGPLSTLSVTTRFDGAIISLDKTMYENVTSTTKKSGRSLYTFDGSVQYVEGVTSSGGYGDLTLSAPTPAVIQ